MYKRQPYTYRWVFGDGSTSTLQNPAHTYESPGTYVVTLTVKDSRSVSSVMRMTINVLSGDRESAASPVRKKPQPRLILR